MLSRFFVIVGARRRRDGLIAVAAYFWAVVFGWIKAPLPLVIFFAVMGTVALVLAFAPKRPESQSADADSSRPPVDPEKPREGARLHSRGVALRDGIRPVGMESLGELVGGVREWERAARRWIEGTSPGAVAEFDAGPSLSDPAVHLIAAQATPRQRREIVEYMDRKLRVLGGIVADLSAPER